MTTAYPYGSNLLVADWRSPKALAFVAAAVLAAGIAIWLRAPIKLNALDDVALRVVFPALLAVVLALAPRPTARLGQIAKDFTVISVLAAIFGGDRMPLLVACFPLVLAAAALCSRTAMARRLWPVQP